MIEEWIRESNLIEGIDDPTEDRRSQLAWNWFSNQELTIDSILKVHKRITWKQLGPDAGRFRRCQVWVGGREGAKWDSIPSLMVQWLEMAALPFTNADSIDFKAGWCKAAHVRFERIHPFRDGNGRTGRMIMNWQLKNIGITPILLKSSERWAYYDWFKL